MQPFFYFQFFTFDDYTSPIMSGSSPHFDVRKQFEIESSEQFIEYMRSQVLKIDLIDESVDIMRGGVEARDYIGSVRVPLKDLIQSQELADNFPVRDEKGVETGRMEVKITCRDS